MSENCQLMKDSELKEFKAFLKLQKKSDNTIKAYCTYVNLVLRSVPKFNQRNFKIFLADYIDNHKGRTVNLLINACRNYAKFRKIKNFKVKSVPETDNTPPHFVTKETVEKVIFMEKMPNSPPEAWERMQAMLELLCYTGLRSSEVKSITKSNIFWDEKVIYIPPEVVKNNQSFYAYIPPNIFDSFKSYVDNCTNERIFLTKTNTIPSNGTLNKHLARRCAYLKIQKITCHDFRHAFGQTLYDEDVPIEKISRALNHKSLETTMIYAKHSRKALINTIERHPTVADYLTPDKAIKNIEEIVNKMKFNEKHFDENKIRLAKTNFINSIRDAVI